MIVKLFLNGIMNKIIGTQENHRKSKKLQSNANRIKTNTSLLPECIVIMMITNKNNKTSKFNY